MAYSSLTAAVSRLPSAFRRRPPPPLLNQLSTLFSLKPKVQIGNKTPTFVSDQQFHFHSLTPKNLVFNQPKRFISTTTMMAAKESADNNPGLQTSLDEATKGYFMQHTMLRIKDPKVSLDFYSRIMGMSLLKRLDIQQQKFTLYFLGYEDTSSAPTDAIERTAWTVRKKAVLELAHMWGTESDPDFKGYHSGNSEPLGYGHIGVTVDDLHKASKRFASLGVEFAKKPEDGDIKDLAFIKDPDGYWIEIFDMAGIARSAALAAA